MITSKASLGETESLGGLDEPSQVSEAESKSEKDLAIAVSALQAGQEIDPAFLSHVLVEAILGPGYFGVVGVSDSRSHSETLKKVLGYQQKEMSKLRSSQSVSSLDKQLRLVESGSFPSELLFSYSSSSTSLSSSSSSVFQDVSSRSTPNSSSRITTVSGKKHKRDNEVNDLPSKKGGVNNKKAVNQ